MVVAPSYHAWRIRKSVWMFLMCEGKLLLQCSATWFFYEPARVFICPVQSSLPPNRSSIEADESLVVAHPASCCKAAHTDHRATTWILGPVVSRQRVPLFLPCFTLLVSFWSFIMSSEFTRRCVWAKGGWAVKLKRMGVGCWGWGAQTVKHVVEQKFCSFFFFLFNKRKCGAVSFLSAWCQTGVFSAPLQRLSLNTWEATSVLRVALLLTVWNVWLCVRACVCVFVCAHARVVVTEKWCACSDCILWPSALNK